MKEKYTKKNNGKNIRKYKKMKEKYTKKNEWKKIYEEENLCNLLLLS